MSPFCEICETPFVQPNREDHADDCIICGNECCAKCIDKTARVCKECDTSISGTLVAPEETPKITEKELDPANWSFDKFETDCGWCCTPNGCMGHPTPVNESITIGRYTLRLPVDDLTDKTDWDNLEAVSSKLEEVIKFYVEHHGKPPARNMTVDEMRDKLRKIQLYGMQ